MKATWRNAGLVAAGGMVGTALRAGLDLLIPDMTFPLAIFIANLLGAFLLGLLTERLSGRDRPAVRLFAGTGILGGFTTYSALATDTALLTESSPQLGLIYGAATVCLGFMSALAGILVARRQK